MPRGRPIVLGYVPALDGLRAIAIFGVMLYHGGVALCGGGFMGVNVFFVLSGFLITSLLLGEWGERATIRLGQFWARRARRLLPALLLMLFGVAVLTLLYAGPGEYPTLRLDALSTLFYVANWHFVVGGSNYFALAAQPSPLAHMWSLSIEEQFYILWPPVVLLTLRASRRLGPRGRLWPLLGLAVAGALASSAVMAALFRAGASATRLYEGTDTRSQDILVGAALAIALAIWAERRPRLPVPVPSLLTGRYGRVHPAAGTAGVVPPHRHRRDLHRRRGPQPVPIGAWEVTSIRWRILLQVVGFAALGSGLFLWTQVEGTSAALFEGGFLLFAMGVAALILSIVTAQLAPLARGLGNPVFRFLGRISYGTYLWHLPLFLWLDASRTHLTGAPLLALRIGTTLVVATASYYLVELPIRQRRFPLRDWRAWLATAGACGGVVALMVAATVPTTAAASSLTRPIGAQYAGPPVRILVTGDSVAWRLGFAVLASQPQSAYDVSVDNGALLGCGVVRSTEYVAHGVADPTATACNADAPEGEQWPAQWAADLHQFEPNVVLLLAGRWELMDRLIGGRWEHVGEPSFDASLRGSLEQAVRVGTSSGALMVLATAPCFDSGEQPDGSPWPEDSPARLADYNAIVRQVAAAHPANVGLLDLDALMCPSGGYTTSVDGVALRDGDGVHIVPSAAAGQWLDAHILPYLVHLGRLQMSGVDLEGRVPAASSAAAGGP
ncbi:MAG: acyltransferase family protein [Acidimicrobiales bacterium]|nr:acyltransferase family protein [Acidimicrobiales bacterium]